MPRPIWKGTISFGLVSIPAQLHTAVRDHRPHFRLLHAADESPVRYERVCQREGKPVAWEDLATMLIDQLSGRWTPEKYTDEYQQNLMRVINAKVKGTKPRLKDTGPRASGQVVDLMERLRQSLERAPSARKGGRAKAAGAPSSKGRVRKPARSTGRSGKAKKPRRAA